MNNPEQGEWHPQDIRTIAANSIGKDILQALVTEIKLLPKPWNALVEKQQNEIIDRLRQHVVTAVQNAVQIIATNGNQSIPGELEQILIKEVAKATIKIGRDAQSLHDLCELQGSNIFIVRANPYKYLHNMHDIKGESDQRDIVFVNFEATDG